MLISGCEILAPKLLLHSRAFSQKVFSLRRCFSSSFFPFAQNYTGVEKQGEKDEALFCPKPDVSTWISPTNSRMLLQAYEEKKFDIVCSQRLGGSRFIPRKFARQRNADWLCRLWPWTGGTFAVHLNSQLLFLLFYPSLDSSQTSSDGLYVNEPVLRANSRRGEPLKLLVVLQARYTRIWMRWYWRLGRCVQNL